MSPAPDPVALAEKLENELSRLGTALQHIQTAEKTAAHAAHIAEAASQLILDAQGQREQQDANLAALTAQVSHLNEKLSLVLPQISSLVAAAQHESIPNTRAELVYAPSALLKSGVVLIGGILCLQILTLLRPTRR
jgi:hypothetical protein